MEFKFSSKKLIFLILCIVLLCGLQASSACTGVYVGSEVSSDNSTMIARSNDYPAVWPNHITVTPRVENESGRAMPVSVDGNVKAELPQTTYKYTATPYMNSTIASNGEAVYDAAGSANEYGVVMTMSVTAYPNSAALQADPRVSDGICEDSATDLVICQSKTARQAVEVLLGLIDSYGSSESNIAIIADQNEAWYVEMYTGHQYAAVKLPKDMVAVFGNEYSLEYLSDFEDFIISDELISLAEENDFAVYGKNNEINLFETYSGSQMTRDTRHMRTWIGHQILAPSKFGADYDHDAMYPLCFAPDRKVSLEDVCQVLRNRYEGTKYSPDETGRTDMRVIGTDTALSVHVIQVFSDLPAEMSCLSWVSCGPAVYGVFVPVSNDCINVSEAYAANQPVEDVGVFDTDKYPYYTFKELCNLCIGPDNYTIYGQPVQKYWRDAESRMFAQMSEVLANAAKMEDVNARAIYITSMCNDMQTQAFEDGKRLLKSIQPSLPAATIIAEDLISNSSKIEYSAILKDNNGKEVANKTLIFKIDGKSYSAVTDSKGVATVTVTLSEGKHSVAVIFMGDDTLGEKTEYATITINSTRGEVSPTPEKVPLPIHGSTTAGEKVKIAIAGEKVIIAIEEVNSTSNSNENATVSKSIDSKGSGYIAAIISVVAVAILAVVFLRRYRGSGT